MSLVLKNIRKSYHQPGGGDLPVLDIPYFEIQPREQVALVGASGGGKTTLLNIISGITTPDSGEVLVGGVDITRLPEAARDRFRAERIGIIFQTFHLLPAFTALENVLLGMSFARGKVNKPHARELLTEMGLQNRLHHLPRQLSVGEQQRVAIARAIANKPQLLLADEPTASVDAANKQTIIDLITTACRDHEIALLTVTHDPEIAQRFERVVPLREFNQVLQHST
ncbi:MAG: ABC transporter ATP-binding protein [Planctomycetaceae bacterium]|nr:ABC transporter ATP-binding protein [Planctomycetaceae bacterium]